MKTTLLKIERNQKAEEEVLTENIEATEVLVNQQLSTKVYYGTTGEIKDGFIMFKDLIKDEIVELNVNYIIRKKNVQLVRKIFEKNNKRYNYFYCLKADHKYNLKCDISSEAIKYIAMVEEI